MTWGGGLTPSRHYRDTIKRGYTPNKNIGAKTFREWEEALT